MAPVASHAELVADYRWHGKNISSDHQQMLDWVLRVHRQEKAHAAMRPETARDWLEGRKVWRNYYAGEILDSLSAEAAFKDYARELLRAAIASPSATARRVAKSGIRHLKQWIPPVSRECFRGKSRVPTVGVVDFGDFAGRTPSAPILGSTVARP